MKALKYSVRKVSAAVLTAAMIVGLFPVSGLVSPVNVRAAEAEVIVEDVTFSEPSGYYENEFELTLTAAEGSTIYYTIDGNDPKVDVTDINNIKILDSSTKKYTGPIKVTDLRGNVFLSSKENSRKYAENIEDTRSGDKFWVYEPDASKVDRAFIVRAIAVTPSGVDSSGVASRISTRTYFVNNNIVEKYKGAAVMSLVTDPDNLLDSKTGIYVLGDGYATSKDFNQANFMMSGKEAERPANMEFFNGKNIADISRGVGIRIHGGYSRRNQQKSMNIYFRDTYDYGTKNLKNYELIPGLSKYANVMIRNGGNDADYTKFQDTFIQGQVAGLNAGTQATRPCIVYLNGEFWGLYGLTEKYSDNSIQYRYGVDNKNVVMYKDYQIDEGEELDPDGSMLNEYKSLANLDMTKAANYKKFCDMVDEDSYIDYNATEVYIDNGDWWAGCTNIHNHLLWRVADPSLEDPTNPYGDGKWRFCLFDTEYSMDFLNDGGNYYSYSAWNRNSIKDHLIAGDGVFAAVVKNKEFANKFMTRVLDLRNYLFEYYNASNVLDNYVDLYNPLMTMHKVRWGYEDVENSVRRMKTFLAYRGDYALKMIESSFSVTSSDRVNVTVSQNLDSANAVMVNDMTPLQNREWKAVYYKNNKLRLTANDEAGCKFDHWEVNNAAIDDASLATATVTLNSSGSVSIKAVYVDESGEINDPGPTVEPTIAPTAVPTPKATATPTQRPGGNWPGWGWEWPTQAPKDTKEPSASPAPSAAPSHTPVPSDDVNATATPVNTTPPAANPAPNSSLPTLVPAAGDSTDKKTDLTKIYTIGKGRYRLDGNGGAILIGTKAKSVSTLLVPASVKIEGKSYKVVEIAVNALKNCKKLKKVIVKSLTIKKVGACAFKNIYKKAVIKVPKKMLKTYKKLFKGKGQKKTVIIK